MAVSNTAVYKLTLMALLSAISLTGCGGGASKVKATQVAAKVNNDEISVHQLNTLLNNLPNTKPEAAARVRGELLEKLIDQQLAFEQAKKKKLDRSPEVVMAIEMAKRDIVARAYFTQQLASLPKVSDAEIHQYYLDNNAILADRHIYDVEEVSVEPKDEAIEPLQQMAKAGKTADEITAWLTSKDIQFRRSAATRASEQIGAELLAKIAPLKAGDTLFIQGPKNYLVVRLNKVQAAPIGEAESSQRIGQFLQNQRVQKAVVEENKKLRETAKIQYLGEFAAPVPAPAADPGAPSLAPTAEQLEKGIDRLH